jgi:uncharacterized membrane protein
MKLSLALQLYAVAAATFVVLDLAWLGLVANGLYRRILGDLLRDSPNVPAAIAFYALFLAGLTYFAIAPAVDSGSLAEALLRGAAFGLVTYATWDLTNLAVLSGFPAAIVPVDLAWGTVLGGTVSSVTWLVHDRLLG